MKKKKRNFLRKIFSLLLLGIISVTLLGSWTYNPSTDTITSDNLFNKNGNFLIDHDLLKDGLTSETTAFDVSDYIEVEPSINISTNIHIQSFTRTGICFYDINKNYVIGYSNNLNEFNIQNFIVPSNCYFFRFSICKRDYLIDNVDTLMINKGTTLLPYEPYGQTYVNQQRLDDLELEYDDLAEQYSNLYDEKEQLQQQYNQLEIDFNALQQNYNDLSSRYTTLVDEYDTLLEEKQELQLEIANLNSQIQNLQNQIANLKDQNKDLYNSLYGYNYFSNSNNSIIQTYSNDFYNNTTGSGSNLYHTWFLNSFNINDFIVDNRLSAYSLANAIYQDNKNGSSSGGTIIPWGNNLFTSLKLYPSYRVGSSVTSNYYYAKDFNIAIHFDKLSNVNVRVLLAQNTTDIINSNYNYIRYDIDDIVDNSINISFTETSILYNYLVVAVEIQYIYDSNNDNYNGADFIYSNGLTGEVNTAYQLGYDTGYGTASSIYSANIYNLNTEINSLNTTISYLRNEISTLQDRLANNLGWRPLFFAMADTPIEVVSKVLGFELFGVNLFQAFIGIITALAIIWLIRKIWK